MRREKVTAEERVKAAKACAEGRMSQAEAAKRLGVTKTVVQGWIIRYNSPKNLKAKLQAFLNDYKGYGNLFQDYEIKEPKQDPETKRITCDISLTPFYSAKNFIIKVSADKKSKDAQVA